MITNKSGQRFPNEKLARERRVELYKRHLAGETNESLSTQYGISVHRVRAICTKMRKAASNAEAT